jgi:ubiquinone biosynthesis protein UbiJ
MGTYPTGDVQVAVRHSKRARAKIESQIADVDDAAAETLNKLSYTEADDRAVEQLQLQKAALQRAPDRLTARIAALESKITVATHGEVAGLTG